MPIIDFTSVRRHGRTLSMVRQRLGSCIVIDNFWKRWVSHTDMTTGSNATSNALKNLIKSARFERNGLFIEISAESLMPRTNLGLLVIARVMGILLVLREGALGWRMTTTARAASVTLSLLCDFVEIGQRLRPRLSIVVKCLECSSGERWTQAGINRDTYTRISVLFEINLEFFTVISTVDRWSTGD